MGKNALKTNEIRGLRKLWFTGPCGWFGVDTYDPLRVRLINRRFTGTGLKPDVNGRRGLKCPKTE
jgi:hypothetical protein